MAPFGKVHAAAQNAGDRIKAGLAWVNHRYQQGVGLAQRINDYYHTGKKVAGLMMPVLEKIHPEIAPRLNAGLGAMDRLWGTAISSHDDVLAIGRMPLSSRICATPWPRCNLMAFLYKVCPLSRLSH